jgi:hypothetical protein
MAWKQLDRAALDLTNEMVYVEAGRPIAGGRWHVLSDGTVAYETVDGAWQPSVHTAEALADPRRFTAVQG